MLGENIILYDWLSFTLLSDDWNPHNTIELLGLSDIRHKFEIIKGMHGYSDRLYYDGISIHCNGQNLGVWVELSGQGCRCFESFSSITFYELFLRIMSTEHHNITRIDIAFDDHSGILPLNDVVADTLEGNYISKWRGGKVELGFGKDNGKTIYFGSPQSAIRLRIYDKAAERGKDEHWVRVELQLRDDRADACISSELSIGNLFAGILKNYLRFVKPSEDSNKSRWPNADYWNNLIQDANCIVLYSSPGVEYNLADLNHFVFQQAGNAIEAALQIYGIQGFTDQLDRRLHGLPNPKYKRLVQECTSSLK